MLTDVPHLTRLAHVPVAHCSHHCSMLFDNIIILTRTFPVTTCIQLGTHRDSAFGTAVHTTLVYVSLAIDPVACIATL